MFGFLVRWPSDPEHEKLLAFRLVSSETTAADLTDQLCKQLASLNYVTDHVRTAPYLGRHPLCGVCKCTTCTCGCGCGWVGVGVGVFSVVRCCSMHHVPCRLSALLTLPPLVWTGAFACDSLFRHPFQHRLKQTSNIFIHSEEGTQVRTQGATLPQTPLPLPHHMPSLPHLCLSAKLPFSHSPSPHVLHSLSGARKKVQRALSGKSQRKPLVR